MDHPHRADRVLRRTVRVSLSTALPAWCRAEGDTLVVTVYAQPGAKHTVVQGPHGNGSGNGNGDALKIRVAAPPLDGRANLELRRFLAGILQVPRRDVMLLSGDKSRSKRFAIRGGRVEEVLQLAANLAIFRSPLK